MELKMRKGSIIEERCYNTLFTFEVVSNVITDSKYLKFKIKLIKIDGKAKENGYKSGEIKIHKTSSRYNVVQY